jgi:phytoene synthase
MDLPPIDALPLPQRLALAHAPAQLRPAAVAAFALDARLAKFVAQASEPLVGQLRLAWWREQLGKPPGNRASGDVILDSLSAQWGDASCDLVALVDGWERLLTDTPLPEAAVEEFVSGRATIFGGLASLAGYMDSVPAAREIGRQWALADLLAHITGPDRDAMAAAWPMADQGRDARLPRRLRHLAILGSLGRRATFRGGGALIAGRSDALHIMRLGMFGR